MHLSGVFNVNDMRPLFSRQTPNVFKRPTALDVANFSGPLQLRAAKLLPSSDRVTIDDGLTTPNASRPLAVDFYRSRGFYVR